MANPRVHEIASELGIESKIVLEHLKTMGEFVKGPSSSIAPPVARRLKAALEAAGVAYEEPGVFWYEPVPDTEELRVNVSWVASGSPVPGDGYEVVELPAIERAATYRYRGDMPGIGDAWMALIEAAAASGEHLLDPTREVYLESEGPQSEWLTELIIPVAPR